MTTPPENEKTRADAVLPAGIIVTPAMQADVQIHLDIAAEHAADLMGFALDDTQEPAAVFVP